MEQTEISKAIIERFNNLQPEIQDIIINTDYDRFLIDISKKYNLNDEQTRDLELNTTLVLLGNTHPDEYKDELSEDLQLPEEKVNQIISEIKEKILNKVLPIIIQNFKDDEENFSNNNFEDRGTNNDYKQTLYQIGTSYGLQIDKIGEMEQSTDSFLSGKIKSDEYEKFILNTLTIPADKKADFIKEINEKIIKPKIDTLKGKTRIPLPPYSIKKEEVNKLPPLPPYASSKKVEIEKETDDIFNLDEHKEPIDSYNKNGIEIIKENKTTEDNQANNIIKSKEDILKSNINIFENKLFNKTINPTTTTDYSLPKTPAPSNPHDPYHEAL